METISKTDHDRLCGRPLSPLLETDPPAWWGDEPYIIVERTDQHVCHFCHSVVVLELAPATP